MSIITYGTLAIHENKCAGKVLLNTMESLINQD